MPQARVELPCQEDEFVLFKYSNGTTDSTCVTMLQTRATLPCQEYGSIRVPGRRLLLVTSDWCLVTSHSLVTSDA